MDAVQEKVARFISENFYVEDPARLDPNQSLLESGIVDSTGVLEIIGFLEREFAIRVDDDETTPENLDTIARICAFVDRKRSRAGAAALA